MRVQQEAEFRNLPDCLDPKGSFKWTPYPATVTLRDNGD